MSYEIEDRVSIRLFFEDTEVLFSQINSLNFLHMSCSSKIGIPMIHLSLSDPTELISTRKLLGEGSRVQVILSSGFGFKESNTYLFRVNKHRKLAASPSTTYELDGYLDSPGYWIQTALKPRKGTSNDVLASIAEDCGLNYDGENTSDEQVWLPANRRYHVWARSIAEHGYKSETSAMKLGLELDGKLIYRDICDLAEAKHRVTLSSKVKDHIHATDFRPTTSAGFNNVRHAYKSASVYQPLMKMPDEGISYFDEEVTVDQYSDEVTFLRNPHLAEQLTRGPVNFRPLDFGNVHENYHRSTYQSARLNSLFSLGGSLITGEVTAVRLFDNVNVILSASSGTEHEKPFSGIYKTLSRSVYVNAGNYYEKLELLRRAYSTEKK